MRNITLAVLDENAYQQDLIQYYDGINDYYVSSAKKKPTKGTSRGKSKGKAKVSNDQYCYSISPENGLQRFFTVKDGEIKVTEIRAPVLINGLAWLRRLEGFANRLKLNQRFNRVNNQLLTSHPIENQTIFTALTVIAKTNPEIIRAKLSDLVALVANRYRLEDQQIVIDIHSWNSEARMLELLISITSPSPPAIQEADVKSLIDEVYGASDIVRVTLKRETSHLPPGQTPTKSSESFRLLQGIQDKIYRLISVIHLELDQRKDQRQLFNLEYQNDLANLRVNSYVQNLEDEPTNKQHLLDYFGALGKQLTLNQGQGVVGSQAKVKGQTGRIVSESQGQYQVEIEGKVVKVASTEVEVIPSIQQQLSHNQDQSQNRDNYLDVSNLLEKYPDIGFDSLVDDITTSLSLLKIKVNPDDVERTFSLNLSSGFYLSDRQDVAKRQQYGGLNKKMVTEQVDLAEQQGKQAIFRLKLAGKKSTLAKTLKQQGLDIQDNHLFSPETKTRYDNQWEIFKNVQGQLQVRLITGDVMTHQYLLDLGTRFDMVDSFIGLQPKTQVVSGQETDTASTSTSSKTSGLSEEKSETLRQPSPVPSPQPSPQPNLEPVSPKSQDSPTAETEKHWTSGTEVLETNQAGISLIKGPITNIDLAKRPYLLEYYISDYHNLNSQLMGCRQSKNTKPVNLPKSSRPKRHGVGSSKDKDKDKDKENVKEKQAAKATKDDGLVFLDFSNYQSIASPLTSGFTVLDNDYDKPVQPNLFRYDDDIIIICPGTTELGFVKNEAIVDLNQYNDLTKTLNWRSFFSDNSNAYSFSLDGHQWPSITIYLYYMAISPILTEGYPEIGLPNFADYQSNFYQGLKTKGELSLSYLRIKHSFRIPSYWNQTLQTLVETQRDWILNVGEILGLVISDLLPNYGHLTLQNIMLKRAYYAKFTQNSQLGQLLVSTNQARLVNKLTEQLVYQPNNSLMETRYYLEKGQKSPIFNPNQNQVLLEETGFQDRVVTDIKQFIRKTRTYPSETDFRSQAEVILKDYTPAEIKRFKLILSEVLARNNLYFQEILTQTKTKKTSVVNRAYNTLVRDQYQLQIQDIMVSLKDDPQKKEMEIPTESDWQDIDWEQVFSHPGHYQNITEIRINTLNSYLKSQGLICYDVPGDGDCLFHSLVDSLHYYGFVPLHKDKAVKYDLSESSRDISLTLGGSPIKITVYRQAVLQARQDISQKIRDNKDSLYVTDPSGNMTVETAVNLEAETLTFGSKTSQSGEEGKDKPETPKEKGENNPNVTFHNYLEMLSTSASNDLISSGDKTGIWGSDLEIWAAAALYHIDIRVFILNSNGSLVNTEGTLYTYQEAATKFPNGQTYHQDSFQGEIKIAWLPIQGKAAHYISIRKLDTCRQFNLDVYGNVNQVVEEDLVYRVGNNFKPDTGTFTLLETPEKTTVQDNNQAFCYFTHPVDHQVFPKKIYYYGKLVGEESTGFIGFQFNSGL